MLEGLLLLVGDLLMLKGRSYVAGGSIVVGRDLQLRKGFFLCLAAGRSIVAAVSLLLLGKVFSYWLLGKYFTAFLVHINSFHANYLLR